MLIPEHSSVSSGAFALEGQDVELTYTPASPASGLGILKIGNKEVQAIYSFDQLVKTIYQGITIIYGGWSPIILSPTQWYDSKDESTVRLSDATHIEQIDDKSGNNYHSTQTTIADQPTYVGTSPNKYFQFTAGNNIMMDIPDAGENVIDTFTFGLWVYVVSTILVTAQSTSGVAGLSGQRYACYAPNKGSNAGAGLSVGTNAISVFEHSSGTICSPNVWNGGTGALSGGWNFILIEYENRQSKIYLNNDFKKTGLISGRPKVYPPRGFGGDVQKYGDYNGNTGNYYLFDKVLTTQEKTSLYDWDKAKYGH
jgi:hypothetical protein